MKLRFSSTCTLHHKLKRAHSLFSRALTILINPNLFPDIEFISSDKVDKPIENNSCSVDFDLLDQLQHGLRGSICSPYVLNKLISSCANSRSLHIGFQIHSIVIAMGICSNLYINTALVDMHGKCGAITYAQKLFDEMPERNVITWNSLISGYIHNDYSDNAAWLFVEMLRSGIRPTPFTVSAVLVGCSQLQIVELGQQVHCFITKSGFLFNVVVGTALLEMYWKCFNVDDSRLIFESMPDKNVVTWTSMITGYAQSNKTSEAMHMIREMLTFGVEANSVTYNSILSSCCGQEHMIYCQQIHCRILRQGLESDLYLSVSLVTIYSQFGSSLEDFRRICSNFPMLNQISFNAIIAGFSNLGSSKEALDCFSSMRQAGINADFFTLTSILKVIGVASALEKGKQTHALVFKSSYDSNIYVQNGLISMYARCGKIDDAKRVFLTMVEHDTISWNSLLSGCAQHGYGSEAVELFEQMRKTKVKPDLTTFLVVLSACSHVGWLDKGLEYFELLRNDSSFAPPKVEHYACIVDLYGRAGYLDEAEAFINSMPMEAGPSIYKALLSACGVHGNQEIAVRMARKLVAFFPDDPASYVLLSNVMATGGYWDDSAVIHNLMCDRGMKKKTGYSWI